MYCLLLGRGDMYFVKRKKSELNTINFPAVNTGPVKTESVSGPEINVLFAIKFFNLITEP